MRKKVYVFLLLSVMVAGCSTRPERLDDLASEYVTIDDTKRGKGYGKQMLQMVIKKAKEEFGVQKITLGVFDNNPSAFHCYDSLGFKVIGTDTYLIDGEEWTGKEMELD